MNYSKIYEYRFSQLNNMIKKNANKSLDSFYIDYDNMIFDYYNELFFDYKRTLDNLENLIVRTIYNILFDIFKDKKIEIESLNKDNDNLDFGKTSIILNKENKKIVYFILPYLNTQLGKIKKQIEVYKDINDFHIVLLQKKLNNYIQNALNEINKNSDQKIYVDLFDDFYAGLFGENELNVLYEKIKVFNENIRENIGLKTTLMPTKETISAFKNKKIIEITSQKQLDSIRSQLNQEDFNTINSNFIKKEYYKILFASRNFSESFLAAEWSYDIQYSIPYVVKDINYRKEKYFDKHLDKTNIIVGYLKSIEQLLYNLILLKCDSYPNKTILNNHKKDNLDNNKFVPFISKNLEIINHTLGSLIGYLKYEKNYCCNDYFYSQSLFEIVINELEKFRSDNRNGYLHQDNIYTVEEIIFIRNKVIEIYMLLIGGFKLTDPEYNQLIECEEENEYYQNSLFNEMLKWLEPIINYSIEVNEGYFLFLVSKINYNDCCEKNNTYTIIFQYWTSDDKQQFSTTYFNSSLSFESELEMNLFRKKVKNVIPNVMKKLNISTRFPGINGVYIGTNLDKELIWTNNMV